MKQSSKRTNGSKNDLCAYLPEPFDFYPFSTFHFRIFSLGIARCKQVNVHTQDYLKGANLQKIFDKHLYLKNLFQYLANFREKIKKYF